jgi:hypothetical protein
LESARGTLTGKAMLKFCAFVIFLVAGNYAEASVCFKDPEKMANYIFTASPDFYTYKTEIPDIVSLKLGKLLGRDWKCQEPGELCALDVYPWTQAQDGDVLDPVHFHTKNINGSYAVVEMTYTFGWVETTSGREPRRNELLLVQEGASSCWRLDDIISGDWSLKEALSSWPHYQE